MPTWPFSRRRPAKPWPGILTSRPAPGANGRPTSTAPGWRDPVPGPIHWWKLDEAPGAEVAIDSVGEVYGNLDAHGGNDGNFDYDFGFKLKKEDITDQDRYILNHKLDALKEIRV